MKFPCDFKCFVQAHRVLMAVMVSSLSACGPLADAPVLAYEPAGKLAVVSQKTVGRGPTVNYHVDYGGVVSQVATVTIEFATVGTAPATARFTSDAGLLLVEPLPPPITLLQGQSSVVLKVIPQTEGLYYLNVFTKQGDATRVVSVPVKTAHAIPHLNHLGDIKALGNGDHIIAIPVP